MHSSIPCSVFPCGRSTCRWGTSGILNTRTATVSRLSAERIREPGASPPVVGAGLSRELTLECDIMRKILLLVAGGLLLGATTSCTTYYGIHAPPTGSPVLTTYCTSFLIFTSCGIKECTRKGQTLQCRELDVEGYEPPKEQEKSSEPPARY